MIIGRLTLAELDVEGPSIGGGVVFEAIAAWSYAFRTCFVGQPPSFASESSRLLQVTGLKFRHAGCPQKYIPKTSSVLYNVSQWQCNERDMRSSSSRQPTRDVERPTRDIERPTPAAYMSTNQMYLK